MSKETRNGALLIAAGFTVYWVLAAAQQYTETSLYLGSILGSLLLFSGASAILGAQGAPTVMKGAVLGSLIVAFLFGRAAGGVEINSLEDARTQSWLFMAQGIGFTLAGGLPLAFRGSTAVRALVAAAVLGNVAYAFASMAIVESYVLGPTTLDEATNLTALATLLDNFLIVGALVFAFQQPKVAETPLPAPSQLQPPA